MKQATHRVFNGLRKVAAGLRPFSESVWPGARNDLFVAHESISVLAADYAADQTVLDAGCGTGYGSFHLGQAGAKSVIGVDLDRRSIAFAQKRYGSRNVAFHVADLERLDFPDATFSFAIASNSLEHLSTPAAFLRDLRRILTPDGLALIAVPPIYTPRDAEGHVGIHYHRSNLTVSEWGRLIEGAGFAASGFLHHARAPAAPDFASHLPSSLTAADFIFTPTSPDGMLMQPSITAVFLLRQTPLHQTTY